MQLSRLFRHLLLPDWWALRAFPPATLAAVTRAIAASERTHCGELRLVVEAGLPLPTLWRQHAPRDRAIALFSELRVWDTEENSGVLIYLQLIDRRVEIVADRGINARVGPAFWRAVCRQMEQAFREGRFETGTLAALNAINDVLTEHFPSTGNNPNELPDAPLVL